MTLSYEFLITRADEAATEAHEASLDNVRQRALRSEAAWRVMAARTRNMEREREKARLEQERRKIAEQRDQAPPALAKFT